MARRQELGPNCGRCEARAGVASGHSPKERSPPLLESSRDFRVPEQSTCGDFGQGAGEGTLSTQALDEHEPESVDVSRRANGGALELLRSQVGGSAEQHTGHRQPRGVCKSSDAEVRQVRGATAV